jgi:hypothetical protein
VLQGIGCCSHSRGAGREVTVVDASALIEALHDLADFPLIRCSHCACTRTYSQGRGPSRPVAPQRSREARCAYSRVILHDPTAATTPAQSGARTLSRPRLQGIGAKSRTTGLPRRRWLYIRLSLYLSFLSLTRSKREVAQWAQVRLTAFQSCHRGTRRLYSLSRVSSRSYGRGFAS